MGIQTPIIATGDVFHVYLAAARANLDGLVRCAAGLGDEEVRRAAQKLLDDHDSSAVEVHELLDGAQFAEAAE